MRRFLRSVVVAFVLVMVLLTAYAVGGMALCRRQLVADYAANRKLLGVVQPGMAQDVAVRALGGRFAVAARDAQNVTLLSMHCPSGICAHLPLMVDVVTLSVRGNRVERVTLSDQIGLPCSHP